MPRLMFLSPALPDPRAWTDAGVVTVLAESPPGPGELADIDGLVVDTGMAAATVAGVCSERPADAPPLPVIALNGADRPDDPCPEWADAVVAPVDLSPGLVRHLLANLPHLAAMRRQLQQARQALAQAALTDTLTGLGNRTLFLRELDRHVSIAARNGAGFVLVAMDVDGLRVINQNHGHAAGDRVLATVGSRLAGMLRGADMAFRTGGDDFAALITTGVNSYGVETVARRVIREMALPVDVGDEVLSIRVSIGIGFCPEHGAEVPSLTRRIDDALIRARSLETGFAIAEAG